ncbi:hypothetical protein DFO66_101464 [Brevibacterium sanguinis]|uniref:Uncharacterized protein n=2 Tax=Brevibacterium TaxID=1696 RepID=A0A366IMP0_9MICO|nr:MULTISPECIES: polysialyltransferase family glycosyltransferase [Brevibacterium]RBP68235.1 hypothetical protein DFO66_101464 [Brevibacterium sanguinis]RBP74348.1 hypothetical protein DFO65_10165 [Brevibacterium celere]
MKQIFLVSTFFELVCLVAGLDSGEFDDTAAPALLGTGGVRPETPGGSRSDAAEEHGSRERILLVSNNASVLELAPGLLASPGAASLITRFDRVIDLNETLAPAHPSSWKPSPGDLPMVEAHLRRVWDLGAEDIELVLESPQVNPAIALGRVFSRAAIRVHSDGLMTYGPTRNRIPLTNGQRMSTLHYLPLIAGLEPRLLAEFGIVGRPMSLEAFRTVVGELAETTAGELDAALGAALGDEPWAFAVGQYLAALGLLTEDEETDLHVSMIREADRRGLRTVVFKPHPAAPPARLAPLVAEARSRGIDLRVLDLPVLAEVVVERLDPSLVLGGFSTALATARAVFGTPALAVGSDLLLERIAPYQNSNRVPLTIIAEVCDGTAPGDGGDSGPGTAPGQGSAGAPGAAPGRTGAVAVDRDRLQDLVNAVSYCMAPEFSRDLRARAEAFLAHVFGPSAPADAHRFRRYFKRRRLTALALPGGQTNRIAPKRLVRRTGALAFNAATRQQRRLFQRLRG